MSAEVIPLQPRAIDPRLVDMGALLAKARPAKGSRRCHASPLERARRSLTNAIKNAGSVDPMLTLFDLLYARGLIDAELAKISLSRSV
jgi:hypothetical protein